LLGWTIGLAAAGIGFAWAFAYNHGGAGLQYFAPLYVTIAYLLASRVPWPAIPRVPVAVMTGLLIVGLPWAMLVAQVLELRRTADRAETFLQTMRAQVGPAIVYSEDIHLHERVYRGQVIDVGDMITRVAPRGYFGPQFTATTVRQARALREDPPRFVLVGGLSVVSDNLRDLLAARYEVAARSGPLLIGNGGGPLTLYRLHAPSP
jgi:hypothetical protein